MKIVNIKYRDHHNEAIRLDQNAIPRPAYVRCLGWLLAEDDAHYFIVRKMLDIEGYPDTNYEIISILKGLVLEYKVLENS